MIYNNHIVCLVRFFLQLFLSITKIKYSHDKRYNAILNLGNNGIYDS